MKTYDRNTPFVDQNLRHLQANNEAFARALTRLPEEPHHIVEAFAGIGSQTRVLFDTFPNALLTAFERDRRTFDRLQLATCGEMRSMEINWSPFLPDRVGPDDLLVADCNNFTIHEARREDYRDVIDAPAKYLVLTDIARGKLHLNYKSYGLPSPSVELYMSFVADVLGRSLLGYEPTPGGLSYIVLGEKKGTR